VNFIGGKFWCIIWMNKILGEIDDARSEDGGSLGRVMREVIVWLPNCFIYKKSKKRTQTIDGFVSKPTHVVDVRSAIWYIEFHNSHFFIVFLLPLSFIICAHYLICLRVANKQLLEFIYFLSFFFCCCFYQKLILRDETTSLNSRDFPLNNSVQSDFFCYIIA